MQVRFTARDSVSTIYHLNKSRGKAYLQNYGCDAIILKWVSCLMGTPKRHFHWDQEEGKDVLSFHYFPRFHCINGTVQLETSFCCSVAKSGLILCDSMSRSSPGSFVHGIFQASMLGWVVISSSRDLPPQVLNPHLLLRWILYHWATREALTRGLRKDEE